MIMRAPFFFACFVPFSTSEHLDRISVASIRPSLEAACKGYSEADAGRGAEAGSGAVIKRIQYVFDFAAETWATHVAASARPGSGLVDAHTTLGSRPAPGTPSAKRSVGTRRAASMQDTLSEGTARAAQLAPSAVTTSAVPGSATRSVVRRLFSPTTAARPTPRNRACSSTSRSSSERVGQPHLWWQVLRLRRR